MRKFTPFKSSSTKTVQVHESTYTLQHKIADGSQGTIFLARVLHDEFAVADTVVIKKTVPVSAERLTEARREIALLKSLQHEHLVGYITSEEVQRINDTKELQAEVYLVMKHYPGGTLLDYAVARKAKGEALLEFEILNIMSQIARALEFLHDQKPPIAHRDIKLENILLDIDAQNAYLCDFGSCSKQSTRCETKEERQQMEAIVLRGTTPLYRAPELCDLYTGQLINEKVDVWAFGCALFALGFHTHAFEGGSDLAIISGKLNFPETHNMSDEYIRLVRWALTLDPEARPPIRNVAQFMDSIKTVTKALSRQKSKGTTAQPPTLAQMERQQHLGTYLRTRESTNVSTKQITHDFASKVNVSPTASLASSRSKSASDAAKDRLARRRGQELTSDTSSGSSTQPFVTSSQNYQNENLDIIYTSGEPPRAVCTFSTPTEFDPLHASSSSAVSSQHHQHFSSPNSTVMPGVHQSDNLRYQGQLPTMAQTSTHFDAFDPFAVSTFTPQPPNTRDTFRTSLSHPQASNMSNSHAFAQQGPNRLDCDLPSEYNQETSSQNRGEIPGAHNEDNCSNTTGLPISWFDPFA